MKRIFAALTMAAVALATFSLADPGAASAGASSHAAAGPVGNLYPKGEAGYHMYGGGWRFRYIETALTVPAATTRAKSAQIALGNMGWGPFRVYINVTSGGGPGSIGYGLLTGTAKTLAVTPSARDQVKISIYYDRATAQNHFTAVDLPQSAEPQSAIQADSTGSAQ